VVVLDPHIGHMISCMQIGNFITEMHSVHVHYFINYLACDRATQLQVHNLIYRMQTAI